MWLAVLVGVAAMSSSALLVRGMEASPLAAAAWRTLLAALVLSPSLVTARPTRAQWGWSAVAGALLGLHFWAWFESVHATTVLRSTLLVCLTPGWTAVLEWVATRRRPAVGVWVGLAVALPGLALLAGDGGVATAWGDGLALFAGLLWSAYLLVGQRVRTSLGAGPWMAMVCGSAAAVLFGVGVAGGVPLVGFSTRTWALVAAAVALPQLLGHQSFAWAVKFVPARTLSAFTLLEPVGATLLAAALLRERPTPGEWVGMALVLAGTWASARGPLAADTQGDAHRAA